MAEMTLQAKIRDYKGRSASNAARREKKIPGVFYKHNEKNFTIEVESMALRPFIYTTETHVINLELSDGTAEKCVLRDVQFDPVTDEVVHFDLMGLAMDKRMKFDVQIVLKGSSEGVKEGGRLNQILHKLEIECLPTELPSHISVDITELLTGEQITIGDIELETGVMLSDPKQPIVIISHARGEEEDEEEEGEGEELEEGAEPELVDKGKEDSEES